jgi:hypothetical protein
LPVKGEGSSGQRHLDSQSTCVQRLHP